MFDVKAIRSRIGRRGSSMSMSTIKNHYDVVVLGAGHNGLVAASYLGRAGLSVLLLEKNDYIGGATTSQKVFPDYDAWLSRYSYLVSLFPEKIIRDLGLNLELRRRATGSFTPYVKNGKYNGLLLSNLDDEVGRQSMIDLTGSNKEFEQLKKFYNLSRVFATHSWDSMLEPLIAKEEFRRRFDVDDISREAWRSLAEEPLGAAIERYLQNDLVRGLALTDAKIGLFTHPHDPSLVQNRCFLYHLIGIKTGEWKVPVGGMGGVARELEEAARRSGAEFLTGIRISALGLNGKSPFVEFEMVGKRQTIEARFLLLNFGPNVLAKFTGKPFQPDATDEGSVFKINMLLRKLPKLKAKKYTAAQAWCGTFHSDEGYEQMNASYTCASQGRLPEKTPCEVYCHTLTDDSILGPDLREQGYHTMTLFGLDAPWSVFSRDNVRMRKEAEQKFLASMNQWLEEPIEDCLALARDGSPCIESKSPVDIEDSLGMYHGNIFLDAPSPCLSVRGCEWPGRCVVTQYEKVLFCGS